DELVRLRFERRELELECVAPVQSDVVAFGQVRLERAVDLGGVNERHPLGEETREDAETRPDLEHDIVGREPRAALDHPQDVLVDEEVLAERLPWANAHRRKQRTAFSSICAASSSASALRARATAATV